MSPRGGDSCAISLTGAAAAHHQMDGEGDPSGEIKVERNRASYQVPSWRFHCGMDIRETKLSNAMLEEVETHGIRERGYGIQRPPG